MLLDMEMLHSIVSGSVFWHCGSLSWRSNCYWNAVHVIELRWSGLCGFRCQFQILPFVNEVFIFNRMLDNQPVQKLPSRYCRTYTSTSRPSHLRRAIFGQSKWPV